MLLRDGIRLADVNLDLTTLPIDVGALLTPDPAIGIPDVGLGDAYPDPTNIPPGCRFHPRCPSAIAKCAATMPDNIRKDGRLVECLLAIPE